MKVCQIVTGIIPVPNNRWGAVEKVIWNYKKCFDELGIQCDVKYLNEVKAGEYDIVHIHMANLCLEAQARGIDYVFSIHDHHCEYHGKESFIYKQNLKAMKGSLFSITHAPHYLELFEEVDKLFYLPHGVDIDFFTPRHEDLNFSIGILMVANNGLAGDYGIDRKGFEIGISAAKELGLPITIIGADANRRFFELKPHLLEYEGLKVIDNNPVDEEVLYHYHNNTIFLHPSFIEAGHPNLTLLEAASCCLNIVAYYKGELDIYGLTKIEELRKENVIESLKKVLTSNTTYYEMVSKRKMYDWRLVVKQMQEMYESVTKIKQEYSTEDTSQLLLSVYEK